MPSRLGWSMTTLVLISVCSLQLACVLPLPPIASHWEGSSPRVICPTPTPLPTTTPYRIETVQVNALGTPTVVVEEIPPSRPYEREYGRPVTPTTYARSGTVFVVGDIVQIQPSLSMRITTPPPRYQANQSFLRISVETEAMTEFPLIPALQLGISMLRLADGQRVSGFWTPQTLPLADDPDRDGVVVIPVGRSQWEWDVPIADPRAVPEAVDLRLSPVTDSRLPSESIRWMVSTMTDPYCPEWQGIWSPVVDLPPDSFISATTILSDIRRKVVMAALSQLGRPYCFGGKGWNTCPSQCFFGQCYSGCTRPDQFPCWDCSGLVHYAWQHAGITIPHGSVNQAAFVNRRTLAEIQPGDLLFFWGEDAHGRRTIAHVAMYIGDVTGDGTGDAVQASWYGTPVAIVNDWYHVPRYRRLFAFAGSPITED